VEYGKGVLVLLFLGSQGNAVEGEKAKAVELFTLGIKH